MEQLIENYMDRKKSLKSQRSRFPGRSETPFPVQQLTGSFGALPPAPCPHVHFRAYGMPCFIANCISIKTQGSKLRLLVFQADFFLLTL